LSEQQRTQKVEELTQKLLMLKDQREKLDAEAKGWAGKRDKLNEQFKTLRHEILEFKSERDKLNEKVKELKKQRESARTELHARIEELKKLDLEIKAIMKKKPSKSLETLQEEIKNIEWKIQTSSLDLKEEKRLIDRVKQLEIQLNVQKKIDQLNQKILELRTEIKTFEINAEHYHEELTGNAQKSQQIHAKMVEKIEESKKVKIEADRLHKLFLRTREEARPIREDFLKISNQIRTLSMEIQREEDEKKKKSESALREKLEKQAREKMKRGEKLTWEEFQLLAEKGMTAQD
jgi:uncharacterized coiled-coil DUF342 family protein